jgi:phosphatidylglycerol:prolipoprotein diacylglycerol transferase
MAIFEIIIFWIKIAPTYYSLMYVLWFIFWYIILWKKNIIPRKYLDNLLFYIFFGVIIWWRLGYVLFYNLWEYLQSPIDIFKIWEWWMSFHWWVIWVILAMFFFSKKYKFSFLKLADQITLIIPIWLFFGRIWNYLNKELLGFTPYNWPFTIIKNWVSYFPSPLLEALVEWIVLFWILNIIYEMKKLNKDWQIWALFLIFYSIFRIFIEIFFRRPDENIGYILNYFTMWEILSLPMFLVWIYYYFKLKNA